MSAANNCGFVNGISWADPGTRMSVLLIAVA